MELLWLLSLTLASFGSVQAAQILGLFAHPGKSHFDFFRPMFLGLAQRGHNISMYSYFPNKSPVINYTDFVFEGMPLLTDVVDLQIFESESKSRFSYPLPFKIPTFFMLNDWGLRSCRVALNSPLVKQLLESSMRYDVIILEHFSNDCMTAVAHLLGAPVIALSSCAIMPWHYKRMGTPILNSITPMNFLGYTDEMNFVARLNNFLHFHIVNLLYNLITQPATDSLLLERFGPGLPPVNQIVLNTSLMLINQHYSLTGSRSYAPNVVEVGGLQVGKRQSLPAHLERLFKRPHDGIIYISWGSMINPSTLPLSKRREVFDCISRLSSYVFVMRWTNDSLAEQPSNLHIFDWLPQRDLLCHPQVKAFMTHGGLLGSTEAVHCGVPMLVTPFYGDQFLNAAAIAQRQLGVIVDFDNFEASQLTQALRQILATDFARQVSRSTAAFRQRPLPPLELALWWIEHVIETRGAPFAQSVARHINWFTYNSFDVYLFLICFTLLLLSSLWFLMGCLWRLLSKRRALAKPEDKEE